MRREREIMYQPAYAGNLDIMCSAALATAERMAQSLVQA
jgi:acetaldehyde dehydrogenase